MNEDDLRVTHDWKNELKLKREFDRVEFGSDDEAVDEISGEDGVLSAINLHPSNSDSSLHPENEEAAIMDDDSQLLSLFSDSIIDIDENFRRLSRLSGINENSESTGQPREGGLLDESDDDVSDSFWQLSHSTDNKGSMLSPVVPSRKIDIFAENEEDDPSASEKDYDPLSEANEEPEANQNFSSNDEAVGNMSPFSESDSEKSSDDEAIAKELTKIAANPNIPARKFRGSKSRKVYIEMGTPVVQTDFRYKHRPIIAPPRDLDNFHLGAVEHPLTWNPSQKAKNNAGNETLVNESRTNLGNIFLEADGQFKEPIEVKLPTSMGDMGFDNEMRIRRRGQTLPVLERTFLNMSVDSETQVAIPLRHNRTRVLEEINVEPTDTLDLASLSIDISQNLDIEEDEESL
mmetsp:Transcript_24716/g.40514  ORF Transcript_24716/g.40514 Transcript_24716/m.40514 type:complete len:404 (-) Transcript_24716:36-1247(-)